MSIICIVALLFGSADAFPRPLGAFPRHSSRTRLRASVGNDKGDDDDYSTFSCWVPTRISREEGERIMDGTILPGKEYDLRICFGRDAQDLESSTLVAAQDPRMKYTYGEFPLRSTDQLVDLALSHYRHQPKKIPKSVTMIDLGSGCGRLVLYWALTRGYDDDSDTQWNMHGIEISDILHDEALRACLSGLDHGWFQLQPQRQQQQQPATLPYNNLPHLASATQQHSPQKLNQFTLHLGPAEEFASLFQQADIVFAYSTVWDTAGFSEQLGAIVMSREWNELLSQTCRPGTIVITTDRCLDPMYGWKLLDRLDVDNREVMGSTGYIQILEP
ncbi:expressed unknown protein [Seminavis robusta]|uniref:Uncharacterized protein n=1 Tax=Seminavis robusta TaxID=568900 RepID=A0A9N8DID4_9STRA|nr:expressed unknown protein [Seminavis robusta]|eukprot:Sro102_g052000.1 n/a (331) ;mRNA; f:45167-46159